MTAPLRVCILKLSMLSQVKDGNGLGPFFLQLRVIVEDPVLLQESNPLSIANSNRPS